jgi:Sec-independent protein translocase protein TatA
MTWDEPTLLGIAAIVSAVGGVGSTIMAIRKSRSEEEQECLERLKEARAEAEASAQKLHELKMRDAETKDQRDS